MYGYSPAAPALLSALLLYASHAQARRDRAGRWLRLSRALAWLFALAILACSAGAAPATLPLVLTIQMSCLVALPFLRALLARAAAVKAGQ